MGVFLMLIRRVNLWIDGTNRDFFEEAHRID